MDVILPTFSLSALVFQRRGCDIYLFLCYRNTALVNSSLFPYQETPYTEEQLHFGEQHVGSRGNLDQVLGRLPHKVPDTSHVLTYGARNPKVSTPRISV